MKIAYCSDLHFEFNEERIINLIESVDNETNVLILAGDIHTFENLVPALAFISEGLPNTDIVYVTGNHEFYGYKIKRLEDNLRLSLKEYSRIHYLEKDTFELEGVVFLGTTLWTGFDAYPEYEQSLSEENAMRGVSDFHYIYEGLGKFQSHHCKKYYQENVQWLDDTLALHANKTCIVVTHFPPLPLLKHQQIPINSLSNYFQANCEEVILKHSPSYWVYGHNHWSNEASFAGTQFLSCQLGYPNEYTHIRNMVEYIKVED